MQRLLKSEVIMYRQLRWHTQTGTTFYQDHSSYVLASAIVLLHLITNTIKSPAADEKDEYQATHLD